MARFRQAPGQQHFQPIAVFAPDRKDAVISGPEVMDVLRGKDASSGDDA